MSILKIANVHFTQSGNNRLEYSNGVVRITANGIQVPVGTSSTRPAGETGIIRFNTTINTFEGYNSSGWAAIAGDAHNTANGAYTHANTKLPNTTTTLAGTLTLTGSLELGNDTDTTLSRVSAGVAAIEGKNIYVADGADVAIGDGGTGASLTDPNADRILFWNNTSKTIAWLALGTLLSIANSTLSVTNSIPSGTIMLFVQTAAPTGWTKSTTHNNKALRVVSGSAGSGGNTAFTSVFTDRTIVRANLPNVVITPTVSITDPGHAHNITLNTTATGAGASGSNAKFSGENNNIGTPTAASAGATTGITATSSFNLNNNVTQTTMDFAVQYVDVIIATKD